MGDITLGVLKLVHDPSIYKGGEPVITPNPPHFPPAVIEHTLKFTGGLYQVSIMSNILLLF